MKPFKNNVRQRAALSLPPVSLMSPFNQHDSKPVSTTCEQDLGLSDIIQALTLNKRYMPFIRQTLTTPHTNPEIIRWRQQVLNDFLNNNTLIEEIEALLPRLADLREGHNLLGQRRRSPLLETADKIAELDIYISAVQELSGILQKAKLESPALKMLRNNVQTLTNDENFQALSKAIPELREPLQNISSLTIGINLDTQLQPTAVLLLSINKTHFGEPASFLERLIGLRSETSDETGIAPLHHTPQSDDIRILSPLFQDLDRLMNQVAQPIARALSRYAKVSSRTLTALENELAFYAAAARWIQKLRQRGIPFCEPEITENRVTEIEGLFNIALLVRNPETPVANVVELNDEGRIAILTGPNSGGKTTYLRSIGLAHVFFQVGLPIPATQARISPIDAIHTHFPALENRQQGRLAEEAIRLREIFHEATADSLILLNETFSSTSSGEALYLAQDVLAGLRSIGVRAIFATHLTELVGHLDEIETSVPGDSRLFSLTAGIRLDENGKTVPTFQIMRGQPLGRSYAQEIARRHGISLEQILQLRQ